MPAAPGSDDSRNEWTPNYARRTEPGGRRFLRGCWNMMCGTAVAALSLVLLSPHLPDVLWLVPLAGGVQVFLGLCLVLISLRDR
jgi:hypothetical protein